MTTAKLVKQKISRLKRGEPFTSSKFRALGERTAVDKALSRLVASGEIRRVVKGVFVRPTINRYVGEVLPEPWKVAKVIAESAGEKVEIHGAEAARRFGFSTQVPVRPVFYTTGASRRFMLGNLEVVLKKVAKRKLKLSGSIAGQALSALWYLGKENVTAETFERLWQELPQEEYASLKSVESSMPGWMTHALHEFEQHSIAA
jgi:hypothetical protein